MGKHAKSDDSRRNPENNFVMMTGDNKRTARAIARQVGISRVLTEALSEEKAAQVHLLKQSNRKVGDGRQGRRRHQRLIAGAFNITVLDTWFAKLIVAGELLLGIALILGAFVGIAAFFASFMNWNFMMAGTANTNPVLFTLSILLILAWKTAVTVWHFQLYRREGAQAAEVAGV